MPDLDGWADRAAQHLGHLDDEGVEIGRDRAAAVLRSSLPTSSSSRTPQLNGSTGSPLPNALVAEVSASTGRLTARAIHQPNTRLKARTAAPPPKASNRARRIGASTNSLGRP